MLPLTIELRRSTGPDDLERLAGGRAGGGRSSRARPARRARPCRSARRSRTRGAGSGGDRPGTRTDRRTPPRRGSPTRSRARPARRRGSCAPRTSQSSVAVRVKWLIGLTQRRISSTASGSSSGCVAQLLPLVAVLGEGEQPAADRVARGLVARLDEQLAVRDELLLGERLRRRSRRGSARSPDRPAGSARRCSISCWKYACSSPRARLIVCARASRRGGGTRDRPCR